MITKIMLVIVLLLNASMKDDNSLERLIAYLEEDKTGEKIDK